jgi:hypothetical protein
MENIKNKFNFKLVSKQNILDFLNALFAKGRRE